MATLASVFEQPSGCQGQKQRGQSRDHSSNPGPRWCLNEGGECGKKWSNSKCISKVEPTGFADRVRVGEEPEV